MSESYPSIETVFVRSKESHVLELGNVRAPEFAAITSWVITEKVDGMNIRFILRWGGDRLYAEVRGRTDAAQLPPGIKEAVEREVLGENSEVSTAKLKAAFGWVEGTASELPITIYGEGFGEGIQKNPLKLSGKRFRAFDIKIGSYWLPFTEVVKIGQEVGFRTVPVLGLVQGLPANEAGLNELTKGQSRIATEPVRPEGVVARPLANLFNSRGERVIWKLTYREFDAIRKLEEKFKVQREEETIADAVPTVSVVTG